jgi:hypothetical protein
MVEVRLQLLFILVISPLTMNLIISPSSYTSPQGPPRSSYLQSFSF